METNQKGQSTVEFILTFAFGVSLIMLVFSTSLNYATGYLVHYATFMASRVYLTGDSNLNMPMAAAAEADQRAKDVFAIYNLSVFDVPNSNLVINRISETMQPSEYLTVGAKTEFQLKMDIMGRITGGEKLEMVSESFLGKEPTRAECAFRVCFAVTGANQCSAIEDTTLFDNGC